MHLRRYVREWVRHNDVELKDWPCLAAERSGNERRRHEYVLESNGAKRCHMTFVSPEDWEDV